MTSATRIAELSASPRAWALDRLSGINSPVPVGLAEPEHRAGQEVGRYRLESLLGRGASGDVWRAACSLTSEIRKTVALKLFRPDAAACPGPLREASALVELRHPNVVSVLDVDPEGAWLAMELVEGVSLARVLHDAGEQGLTLPRTAVLRLAERVAHTLVAVHGVGLVHRDLKPSNVMIDRYGVVKLVDFGIAGRPGEPEDGVIWGTPDYMSPEQEAGRRSTATSDMHALGVLIYEMATGSPPPRGERSTPLDSLARFGPLAEPLAELIDGCRLPDPDERTTDAGAVRDALRSMRRRLPAEEEELPSLVALIQSGAAPEGSLVTPEWIRFARVLTGASGSDQPSATLALLRDGVLLPLRGVGGVIGSSQDPGIVTLSHPQVSGRHLAWRRLDCETIAVRDLRSTNGTWRAGERLGPEETVLLVGDRVDIGGTGEWLLVDRHPERRTEARSVPALVVREGARGSATAQVVEGGEVSLRLRGRGARLLSALLLHREDDVASGRDAESAGWVRRDDLDRLLWGDPQYDYRRLGRLLHDLRSRLGDHDLPDPLEFREARSGRRASSPEDRIGMIRLRSDGAWMITRE